MVRRRTVQGVWAVVLVALSVAAVPAAAQTVKEGLDNLDAIAFQRPEFRVPEVNMDAEAVRSQMASGREVDLFRAENGLEWKVLVDARRGRPALVDGGAIPFIPGPMNALPWEAASPSCRENACIPVGHVEKAAREFLRRYSGMLGVNPDELVLDPDGSGPVGNSYYLLRFQWLYGGLPVEGASVFFRINNGNLLQVATTGIGDIGLDPTPSLSSSTAMQILQGFLGPYASQEDKFLDTGSLSIVPMVPAGADPDLYRPEQFGHLIAYRLVWRIVLKRPEVVGTWEALVDAHTGEVLRFVDSDRYGRIHGGIRPTDGLPAEEDRPFPFADTGMLPPNKYSDANGNFSGNSATTTLNGKYAKVIDACGAISASTTTGEINFGSGPTGTDCSVPTGNTYGAGNTKPSRTLFYNCTMINLRAQVWAPSNGWLQNFQLKINVNGTASCNASGGGGAVNFYKKKAGCNNLGEIPGVAMHEWAHNYDSYDGSGNQAAPVETYADWTAIMQTHLSCTGAGFLTSGNCGGYGDACTSCTGIRDCDYSKHTKNTAWTASNHGTVWSCGSGNYNGPCGWEDHCESGISTQALWDFVTKDLTAACPGGPMCSPSGFQPMDLASAWALEDRLWFTGVSTLTIAYNCTSSVTTGCGSGTLYTVMRFMDDDGDGTANGTPHAAAIFSALNRHQIACGAAGDTANQNQRNSSCPTLAKPTLTGSGGPTHIHLSWSAVTGATRYFLYRTEGGCASGFTRIAVPTPPTTTYTDTGLVNGANYYYRVQAVTDSDSCTSTVSDCLTVQPVACASIGTPTSTAVTVPGTNRLQVSWSAGTPAGATYKIYRSFGACPGGTFALLASGVTASPYVDTTVSGAVTYSYKVTAVDSSGDCESALSTCASATGTGTCTSAPNFAGVATVANGAVSACTLNLTWTSVSAFCGGPVTYRVYRDTTNPFTPSAGNRIASGLSGTSYADTAGLVSGTTYFYIVHAVDSANGAEDGNTKTLSGLPTGVISSGTWQAGAEADSPAMAPESPWGTSTTYKRTGTASYFSGYTDGTCAGLVTPPLTLATSAVMTYYHIYSTEANWDGGRIEISQDGGLNWTALTPSPAYGGTLSSTGSPPVNACGWASSTAVYTGNSTGYPTTWPLATVTIPTTYNNKTVLIRWEFSTDPASQGSGANPGWYIDDISITNVMIPAVCTTSAVLPAEAAPGGTLGTAQTWTDKTSMTWPAVSGATGYKVYRGILGDLPKLQDSQTDSCDKTVDVPNRTATANEDPTTGVVGRCYWYLVTASNSAGEGTAGSATAWPRVVNSSGSCSP